MSPRIDSAALSLIRRALTLAGAGAQTTELEDSSVVQTLSVNELVSAASSPGLDSGFFISSVRNVHAGADAQLNTTDPYNPGTVFSPGAGTLKPLPRDFDAWYMGSVLQCVSADASDLSNATVLLTGWNIGWTEGEVLAAAPPFALEHFSDANGTVNDATLAGGGFGIKSTNAQLPFQQPVKSFRWPRGTILNFYSESGAAATYRLLTMWGMCPIGLRPSVF